MNEFFNSELNEYGWYDESGHWHPTSHPEAWQLADFPQEYDAEGRL